MASERVGGRCAFAARLCALTVVLVAAVGASGALIEPGAGLTVDSRLWHPDAQVVPSGVRFHPYIDAPLELSGWTLEEHMPTAFTNNLALSGVMISDVWRNDVDGNLLFAYQIENTGDPATGRSIRIGNVVGYDATVAVLDTGILHAGGTGDFAQGDVLYIDRCNSPKVEFSFEAKQTELVQKLLAPGQTSCWFYLETDATQWVRSVATMQDSGQSEGGIPVLVPVPEPATLALVGLGLAVTALRRRRRR